MKTDIVELAKEIRAKCNKMTRQERRDYYWLGFSLMHGFEDIPLGTNPMRLKRFRKATARRRTERDREFTKIKRNGQRAGDLIRNRCYSIQDMLSLAS